MFVIVCVKGYYIRNKITVQAGILVYFAISFSKLITILTIILRRKRKCCFFIYCEYIIGLIITVNI